MLIRHTPLRRTGFRRRNMYGAKPVHLPNGQSFDSRGEYDRYQVLQLMEKAGSISGLALHPVTVLVPENGKAKAIRWKSDYEYIEDGRRVIEDYKPRKMTGREHLLCLLWQHYGPCLLRITGHNAVVIKTVMPIHQKEG